MGEWGEPMKPMICPVSEQGTCSDDKCLHYDCHEEVIGCGVPPVSQCEPCVVASSALSSLLKQNEELRHEVAQLRKEWAKRIDK